MTNNIESVTIDHSVNLNEFLLCLDLADKAEVVRFNETERAINLLKLMRNQYSTLQDGRSIGKPPQAGEMPAAMYHEVIQGIYNFKKQAAEEQKQDFTLKYDSYRDFQVKSLKYYIETGDLFNNKKSTLQERALIAIDKLEKKLKADKAKADKLRLEKEKADKAKAEAEAEAEKIKAEADEIINDVHEFADFDPSAADAIKSDLCDILDDAEATIAEAELSKADAIKTANKVTTEAKKAEAEVVKTTEKLAKTKEKLAKLSAPKVESSPSLNIIEFSKDCREMMVDVLNEMVKDYSDVELLCLSTLINKRFKK